MRVLGVIGVAVVMMVMSALVWTGCESTGGMDGVGLSPASATLGTSSTNSSSAVVFTAQLHGGSLSLPLAWRVSNTALGNIVSASGSNATYQANSGKTGDNVVTVTDQYGNEGSAVVTQD